MSGGGGGRRRAAHRGRRSPASPRRTSATAGSTSRRACLQASRRHRVHLGARPPLLPAPSHDRRGSSTATRRGTASESAGSRAVGEGDHERPPTTVSVEEFRTRRPASGSRPTSIADVPRRPLPPADRSRGMHEFTKEQVDAERPKQKRLYEAGYAGITWPKEFGGQGLSPTTNARSSRRPPTTSSRTSASPAARRSGCARR